ncbi:MAG TPA: Rieske 2Fe-2S domain-containing protein [Ktedonobacteraceae bacterium]
MSGEDQERFEDYLELEHFAAELQAGHVAYPPQELTQAQARVYLMAMLFHAATPGVSEPDPEFASRLQLRLEQELQALQQNQARAEPAAPIPLPDTPKPKRRLPRRWLLVGGVSAAASIALTAGATHMVDVALHPPDVAFQPSRTPTPAPGSEVAIKVNSPMDWFPVTTVAQLSNQAIKFRVEDQHGTLSLTGYVLRSEEDFIDPAGKDLPIKKGEIIAMSAACTHKGCIVEWSDLSRQFLCPCHGGIFNGIGGIDNNKSSLYLKRLPLLEVQVAADGQINVRMPDK